MCMNINSLLALLVFCSLLLEYLYARIADVHDNICMQDDVHLVGCGVVGRHPVEFDGHEIAGFGVETREACR